MREMRRLMGREEPLPPPDTQEVVQRVLRDPRVEFG
jgi:hypothetical protein